MRNRVRKHWPLTIIAGLAVVGLIDALYLTAEHYIRFRLPCLVTHGCEQVLTSQYSTIFGVPVAVLGVVFYTVVLAIALHFFINDELGYKWLTVWGGVGFIASLALTYIQGFVIRAWCQYCLLSAIITTTIFTVSLIFLIIVTNKKGDKKDESKS